MDLSIFPFVAKKLWVCKLSPPFVVTVCNSREFDKIRGPGVCMKFQETGINREGWNL